MYILCHIGILLTAEQMYSDPDAEIDQAYKLREKSLQEPLADEGQLESSKGEVASVTVSPSGGVSRSVLPSVFQSVRCPSVS